MSQDTRSQQHRHFRRGPGGTRAGPAAEALAPSLERLFLRANPLGDEGLAALVPPPPPTDVPPPVAGLLPKLKVLNLRGTNVSDDSCAVTAAALERGGLPALESLNLYGTQASGAAKTWLRSYLRGWRG